MKRTSAVFTIVRNEKFFLPIWLRYFSKYFYNKDIFILDNNSNDGSTANLNCNLKIINNELYFDHGWLVQQVKEMQAHLLNNYDYIVFCECDEIIVPDPRIYSGLNHYIYELQKDSVRCVGFEVLHIPDKESPFIPNIPLFLQRHYWHENQLFYSKPVISRIVLDYCWGFHSATNCNFQDKNLYMIHLHKVDYTRCKERHEWQCQQLFKDDGLLTGWHHRVAGQEFEDFYYGRGQQEGLHSIVEIPDWMKGIL